jgi:enoyl-CoA hydratase/carnithine racemase
MSQQLFADIRSFFSDVNQNPEARVVILTGNGKNFCAGIDIKEFGTYFNVDDATGSYFNI